MAVPTDGHEVAPETDKDGPVIGYEDVRSTAENYRRFARIEARGRSPLYELLAVGVAEDRDVLSLVESLPAEKRQPNLLLAAVRYLYGTPPDYRAFRTAVLAHWQDLSVVMRSHRTQTNEVARAATMLPLLLALPQPLALFEMGASAGLCLWPDRYRYDYGDGPIGPPDSPVLLRCECRGAATPVPTRLPEVVWRAGCDLDPIDVADAQAVAWLEALVWPGEADRLERLRAALDVARRTPVRVVRRDIREGIGDLVDDVPAGATLVIFHSAVLAYVASSERAAVVAHLSRLDARWIANEGPRVLGPISDQIPQAESAAHVGDFLLSLDGQPVAWTDPHGTWVHWRSSHV